VNLEGDKGEAAVGRIRRKGRIHLQQQDLIIQAGKLFIRLLQKLPLIGSNERR